MLEQDYSESDTVLMTMLIKRISRRRISQIGGSLPAGFHLSLMKTTKKTKTTTMTTTILMMIKIMMITIVAIKMMVTIIIAIKMMKTIIAIKMVKTIIAIKNNSIIIMKLEYIKNIYNKIIFRKCIFLY